MTSMIFRFPLDPVPWARPRFNGKRAFTKSSVRTFCEDLKLLALQQYGGNPMEGALKVDAVFSLPRPKSVRRRYPSAKPDIDNLWKGVADALEGILWKNDSQIVSLHVTKTYADTGYIILEVWGEKSF